MSLVRSTAVVALAAAASRVLGFVRDVLIAGVLGAGPAADAFLIAYRLPNLIRRVLAEGGLNAGFVPLYARVRAEHGEASAAALAAQAFWGLALVLTLLAVCVEVFADAVVLGLALGIAGDPATLDHATLYMRLAFPFVIGATLASLVGAMLNAERRFAAAALAPVAINAALIAALATLAALPLPPERRAAWLALTVAGSGFLHLAIVAAAARRRFLPVLLPRPSPKLRRLAGAVGGGLLASGAAQFFLLAGAQIASFTPSGVSWLYYADRVFQLPLGFVGAGLGIVILSDAAARHAADDRASIIAVQNRAIEAGLALSLPAAFALALLAEPIARVLFERGAFTSADTTAVSSLLAGLAPALPFAVAGKVLCQAFFARGEHRPVLRATLLGLAATLGAGLVLSPAFGPAGIGLGVAAGFATHAGLLAAGLRRRGLLAPDARLMVRSPRIAAASLVMAAALAGAGLFADAMLGPMRGAGIEAALLAMRCLGGFAIFAGAAWRLGAITSEDLAHLARP